MQLLQSLKNLRVAPLSRFRSTSRLSLRSSSTLAAHVPVLKAWNKGIFATELINKAIFPRPLTASKNDFTTPAEPVGTKLLIPTGTYDGTKKAATEMYSRIQQRFASYFDVAGFESAVPLYFTIEEKRTLYTFQKPGSDKWPPHLNLVPHPVENDLDFLAIFNTMRLLDTGLLLPRIIPEKILDFVNDDPTSNTMAGLEARNHAIRVAGANIGQMANIGDRKDWYSDAVFAQQHFTGPNPATIEQASSTWIAEFQGQAKLQDNREVVDLISSSAASSFYVQDYSYFRDAYKTAADAQLKSDDGVRFGCASVCLFQLNADGKLHPLAIVLDYKGTMEKSVIAFNKRLSPNDASVSEGSDWAWRYAKLCVQVSDATRHELTVHLTDTHFVEEVVAISAHRTLPQDNIVYRLLEPHWLKTLALNATARSSLVPGFWVSINGTSADQAYNFVGDAYQRFDWKARYIPTDLATRGFPVAELDSKKYHNYAYGRNMIALWNKLRGFVSSAIKAQYPTDEAVVNDKDIQAFAAEMQSPDGGAMSKFPDIKTIEELIDVVVMAIHIASPQHTAVNYLQDYYQAFVPNKPTSLCAPVPNTLAELAAYTEKDMIAALPVNHPRIWLMSSHIAYLLSSKVEYEQTLMNYALSLSKLDRDEDNREDPISAAAGQLVNDLRELQVLFEQHSKKMDDQTVPYNVLDPEATAVSILI